MHRLRNLHPHLSGRRCERRHGGHRRDGEGMPWRSRWCPPCCTHSFPASRPAAFCSGFTAWASTTRWTCPSFWKCSSMRRRNSSGATGFRAISPWPLISPICPVVVRLIAFQFPSLLPHVLPVLRPVALMAREVKKQIIPTYTSQGRQVALYFVNPCPTKAEFRSDRLGAPPHARRPPSGSTTCIRS